MAKPLSPKSKLIREALKANPNLGNADLARQINSSDARKEDKIKVTATDVGNQKQALKAMNATARKKAKAHKPATSMAANKPQATPMKATNGATKAVSPVELVERVFDLADQCGGFAQLKRLVGRLSAVRR
jgi:hypothetical protein